MLSNYVDGDRNRMDLSIYEREGELALHPLQLKSEYCIIIMIVSTYCILANFWSGEIWRGNTVTILSVSVARIYPNQQFVGTIGAIGRDSGQGC